MHPFRAAVQAHDQDALAGLLGEEVVFRGPLFFKPYRGRDPVMVILRGVSQVLEDWRCIREIGSPDQRDHVIHFQARYRDLEVEGADMLHLDKDGMIDELVVLIRPLSAAVALAAAMKEQVAAHQAQLTSAQTAR